MTDVWKSNPKHFCDFCKCWIADNKPSREFHESGKRHQENVKRRISEVRKSAVVKAQKEDEENSYFKEMERKALKAFKKDLKKNPSLVSEVRKKKPTQPNPQSSNEEKAASCPTAPSKGEWHIAFSDQGYPYYWNDATNEVTWVKPDDYVPKQTGGTAESDAEEAEDDDPEIEADIENPQSTDEVPSVETTQEENTESTEEEEKDETIEEESTNGPDASPPEVLDICDIPLPGSITSAPPPAPKTSPSKADTEQTQEDAASSTTADDIEANTSSNKETAVKSREATKRPHSDAYGGWEQIQEEEPVDLQLPQSEEPVVEQKVITVTETKFKFKEKKVNSLGADLIAFKKRKQAQRSLKSRNTDS